MVCGGCPMRADGGFVRSQDFPSLQLGSMLLVRDTDGVWYPAVLLGVLDAAGATVQGGCAVARCRVRFVEHDAEGVVPRANVMPMDAPDASDDDDSGDEVRAHMGGERRVCLQGE